MDKNTTIARRVNFQKALSTLLTQKEMLTQEYVRIREEIDMSKKRIDIEPELKGVLERFQRKEQEKLVGMNQKLLTAILQDVMQTDGEDRKVVMDIFTERGLPALSILIEKNDQGVLEDVYDGSGGAIANILSFGLRVIALLQSKKRKFLVLDEPDCWIKPELIPDFVDVIRQLSEKLGIQILIISHHNEELLKGLNHRLILEKIDGRLQTRWSTHGDCVPAEWNEEQEGIRSVYLENFQSHSSTYIPLSPTVTLITGLNDLGKSTIVNALRAIFYGNGSDTNIKHFENQARVVVDFGDCNLIWERKLKGKPKESYTLINQENGLENPLHRSDSAKGVPEWLEEETGIGMIEGFDIQLGHQKRPVFILDETPSKKAKALSIGDESNYVQMMINLAKEDLGTARKVVKQGEEELERIYRKLRLFEKYAEDFAHLESEALSNQFMTALDCIQKKEKLEELKEKYKKAQEKVELLRAVEIKLETTLPQPVSSQAIKDLNRQKLNIRYANIQLPKIDLALPEVKAISTKGFDLPKKHALLSELLAQTQNIQRNLAESLSKIGDVEVLNKSVKALKDLNLPRLKYLLEMELPKTTSLTELEHKELEKAKTLLNNARLKIIALEQINHESQGFVSLLKDASQELEEFLESMKICPMCQRPFNDHQH